MEQYPTAAKHAVLNVRSWLFGWVFGCHAARNMRSTLPSSRLSANECRLNHYNGHLRKGICLCRMLLSTPRLIDHICLASNTAFFAITVALGTALEQCFSTEG
jgi:hypothetical protein